MTEYIDSYYEYDNNIKGYLPSNTLEWAGARGDLPLGMWLNNLTRNLASADESEANALERAGLGKYVVWRPDVQAFRLEKNTPLWSEHSGHGVFTTSSNSDSRQRTASYRANMGEFRTLAENRIKYEGKAKNETAEKREARLARAAQYRKAAESEHHLKQMGMDGGGFKKFLDEIKSAGVNTDIWTISAYRDISGQNPAPPRIAVSSLLLPESESARTPQAHGYGQAPPQAYEQAAPQAYGYGQAPPQAYEQAAPQAYGYGQAPPQAYGYGQAPPQQQHYAGNFLPPTGRGDESRSDNPQYAYLGASQQQRPRNLGGRGRG